MNCFFFFFNLRFLNYVCLCLHIPHEFRCPWGPELFNSVKVNFLGGYELTSASAGNCKDSLTLTTEPSLQPLNCLCLRTYLTICITFMWVCAWERACHSMYVWKSEDNLQRICSLFPLCMWNLGILELKFMLSDLVACAFNS